MTSAAGGVVIKTEPGSEIAVTSSSAAAAASSTFEVESIEFACSLTFDTTDLISGATCRSDVIDLLGGDGFGDPTELLPYLGPGQGATTNGTSSTSAVDKQISSSNSDDLLELFS
jgi:hypothetical protein